MFLYISSIKYKKSDIKNMITTATETEGALPVIILRYSWRSKVLANVYTLYK